jgi:tetratricopeptide (TPR) repeat protein
MTHRRATVALVTCLSIGFSTLALHAEDKWIEVKSAHFTVLSNAGQSSARTLAWQLEQIRGAVAALWPWAHVDPDRPLTVIGVRDEPSMKALVPQYWESRGGLRPASVWMSGPDQYYLAIRADQGVEETLTVNPHITAYYSYVSLILQQSVEHDLPLWFSRGLAGVLSNTIVRETDLLLGPPIPWHVERLREGVRLPLPAMLKVTRSSPEFTGGEQLARFDAQAWALVHFLMFGENGVRWPALDKFAKLASSGVDADVAFRESLGRPEDLAMPMATYINQPLFSYKRVKIDVSVQREKFPVRPLAAPESASMRALFHAVMNRPVEARAAVAEARKAGPAPDSFVAEGLVLDHENKRAEAIAAYTQAVEAGSKNAYAHYRLAMLLWSAQADRDTLARIETLLAATIALNTRHADAYEWLGEIRSLLGTGDPLALVRRSISLEPSDPHHRLTAARVLWRQRSYDEALKDVQAALALARNDDDRRVANEMANSIGQARTAAAARSSRPTVPASAADPSSSVGPAPGAAASSAVEPTGSRDSSTDAGRPVFRVPQSGEERLEGTLTRIECLPGKPIVFHLQRSEGTTRVSAPRMADVDFITYRADLAGTVGCGPLKEPLPVYLTARTTPGPAGGKIVVAIEFLPKER